MEKYLNEVYNAPSNKKNPQTLIDKLREFGNIGEINEFCQD